MVETNGAPGIGGKAGIGGIGAIGTRTCQDQLEVY